MSSKLKLSVGVITIAILGALIYGSMRVADGRTEAATEEARDPYTRVVLEIYDSITTNYWETVDAQKLMELFSLAAQKVASSSPLTASSTRAQFGDYISTAIMAKPEGERKAATLAIGELVLTNLAPFGRSHILTLAQEKDLRNTVSNINPASDLYAELGVAKDASLEDIEKVYTAKAAELAKDKTPEGAEKLKALAYAKNVLTDANQKKLYDTDKIEPTLFLKELSDSTLYLNLTKFSPTTLNEFADTASKLGAYPKARNLIIDMRGNIGGSFDIVPYLSGFFIGPNQYAFDLFKKGEPIPFKTPTQKIPELNAFKHIIVLIDGATQSSAELFASVLKKYNKAVVVGTHSKGWGTIENTFPIATGLDDEKYTLFLVHSITLRDDGEPIEGRGVDPNIDIGAKNWQVQAKNELEDSALVKLIEQALK